MIKSIHHLLFIFQMDASVGTEMGTMTEPECLGPLDPGTSVTLEGIVWHETDGGKRNYKPQYKFLSIFRQLPIYHITS
jgi:hypothetical protein